jgi:RNA 2',3'-cyclic 3'-phosphodiesterase
MSVESPSTRRLFIAVMLPSELQERLARLTDLLAAHRAILRPVRPEGLHFTLRFLGEMTAEQERQAAESCAAAVAGVAAFALAIGGFGAFPNTRRPRVVWLGVREGGAPLAALQRRLEGELLRRHVITAHEDFTPHLTLARVRQEATPADRAALGLAVTRFPDIEQARCTATALTLVHSLLTPHGSRLDCAVGASSRRLIMPSRML